MASIDTKLLDANENLSDKESNKKDEAFRENSLVSFTGNIYLEPLMFSGKRKVEDIPYEGYPQ
jgi:hypothetical protein